MKNPTEQNPYDSAGSGEDQQEFQPQRHQLRGMHDVEESKADWKLRIADARSAWDKLTEHELLKSEGHHRKLADLVRVRYAISRQEAEKQVVRFFNEHGS